MFMFQTLKLLPGHILGIEGEVIGVLGFGAAGLVLLLIPFLDRGTSARQGRMWTYLALGAIVYVVALTAIGYLAAPPPGPTE
jgi:quinol-cytochrome oxidoreductase complex cytochrome b subunit